MPMPRVVAYGSHVETETLRKAREAGCDPVLPRSKFVEELPAKLREWIGGERPRLRFRVTSKLPEVSSSRETASGIFIPRSPNPVQTGWPGPVLGQHAHRVAVLAAARQGIVPLNSQALPSWAPLWLIATVPGIGNLAQGIDDAVEQLHLHVVGRQAAQVDAGLHFELRADVHRVGAVGLDRLDADLRPALRQAAPPLRQRRRPPSGCRRPAG